MVNVFIIHSGKDYDYVKNYVEPYLRGEIDEKNNEINDENHSNILTLKSGEKTRWKKDAKRKIKLAQIVIILIGEDSSNPQKSATMGWEVINAIKYNKKIIIFNPKNYEIPKFLYHIDRFSKTNQLVAKQKTLKEIKDKIDDYDKGYYNVFSSAYNDLSEDEKRNRNEELLDQYKLFQKSSEDLVARRQSVNSFYISVNSAIVALTGLVIGIVGMPTKLLVVLFMCVSGAVLDISWIHILDAYGTLNAAKMKVITLLEKNMPVALYDAEWKIMSDKLNNKKYISFTNSEKRIPKLFLIIYGLIIIISCIIMLINL